MRDNQLALSLFTSHTCPVNLGFFVLNVVGAVLYLVGTSRGWVNPAEHGMIPVTGEPFVWASAAVPMMAAFTVLNLIWGVLLFRRGRWRGSRVWLATAVLWLVVIFIDFAHHGYPTWTYWWHS